MILRYLVAQYKDGARGEDWKFDCWGLVRHARRALYGGPLLPEYAGELRFNPSEFTKRYREQARKMVRLDTPRKGSIAAVVKGIICVHVGLVTHDITGTSDQLFVLDINPKVGAAWRPLKDFERDHYGKRVLYYDDKDLPKRP